MFRSQLLRYLLTGSMATVSHYAVLIALHAGFQWAAGWSSAIGALVGAAVAYVGNYHLTFAGTTTPHQQAIPLFAVISVVGAIGNGLLVAMAVRWDVHYLIAQAGATLAMLGVTYHLNRRWTFR